MIPNPYLILASVLGFLAWSTGISFYWNHHGHTVEKAAWVAVQAQERAAAATVQAEAEKRAREAENKAADIATQMEKDHDQQQAIIDASAADFDQRLRLAATARQGRCNSVPVPATSPSVPAVAAAGSNDGYRCYPFEVVEQIRAITKKLQADVKDSVDWAATIPKN